MKTHHMGRVAPKAITYDVLSWNCLADCYAQSPSPSARKESSILRWSHRSKRIFSILRERNADIVCLQEVDHFDEHFKPFFSSMCYTVVYVQRPGREDGVLVAVKKDKFEILEEHIVQFDDLARFEGHGASEAQRYRFKKQNVALILLVRTKGAIFNEHALQRHSFTVCTTHMYWNPSFPQVKHAQARYLLERIAHVREQHGLVPNTSILAGDFNSLPNSDPYRCVLAGIPVPSVSGRCISGAVRQAFSAFTSSGSTVRFLCDGSLSRLARWLRLLGVNAALEDKVSQDKRTGCNDFSSLFEKARSEQRVLVTTSTAVLKRASCPETFLVKTSNSGSLETCLTALLNRYNVELDRANFLSICGKCGAVIEPCSLEDSRLQGKDVPSDRELFICSACFQVYWWSASANGCSARASQLAKELYVTVQQSRKARVKTQNDCNSEIRNDLLRDCSCSKLPIANTSGDRRGERDFSPATKGESECKVQRPNWLRYKSALSEANGKEPRHTNVNGDFRGTLDYIFVGGLATISEASIIEQSSTSSGSIEKAFPNHDWPSDHMILTATFSFKSNPLGRTGFARTLSSHF